MAADEHIRRIIFDSGCDSSVPASGPPTDVGHPQSKSVEFYPLMLQCADSYRLAIDVSPDRLHGCQLLELVQDLGRTHVTGMENQIDVPEKFRDGRVEIGVRVGDDAQGHVGTAVDKLRISALHSS